MPYGLLSFSLNKKSIRAYILMKWLLVYAYYVEKAVLNRFSGSVFWTWIVLYTFCNHAMHTKYYEGGRRANTKHRFLRITAAAAAAAVACCDLRSALIACWSGWLLLGRPMINRAAEIWEVNGHTALNYATIQHTGVCCSCITVYCKRAQSRTREWNVVD